MKIYRQEQYAVIAMDSKYDFIVVEGGLAGLVVAARLTEDPRTSVLVVEAGEDHTTDTRVRTPALWTSLLGFDEFDWNYRTAPQVSHCVLR